MTIQERIHVHPHVAGEIELDAYLVGRQELRVRLKQGDDVILLGRGTVDLLIAALQKAAHL